MLSTSQYTRQGKGPASTTPCTPVQAATPRSILKCSTPQPPSSRTHPNQPHPCVRFPSSPKLSTVHITHCSTSYDRTPITIGPNSCALPERGSRSYSPSGMSSSPVMSTSFQWSNHVHPSVLARQVEDMGYFPPPLMHDSSESSEDSDGIASPPPEASDPAYQHLYSTDGSTPPASFLGSRYASVPRQSHLHSDPLSHPPIPNTTTSNQAASATDYSMSFLPHAPSSSPTSKKRHNHHERMRKVSPSFGSSWCQSDEASCLGGF